MTLSRRNLRSGYVLSRSYLLVVVAFALVSGCTGSSPTSPSSGSSAAPIPESIEIISATAPAGTTLTRGDCLLNWDFVSCFPDLQHTFEVRSNRYSGQARLSTELLTSDGRVCGETEMVTPQPIVAGVVATFRTTAVYLKPDCFDLLPFRTATLLARVTTNTPGAGPPSELMKQEFAIGYTFVP